MDPGPAKRRAGVAFFAAKFGCKRLFVRIIFHYFSKTADTPPERRSKVLK